MSVDRIPPSIAISVGVHVLLAAGWYLADVGPERRDEPARPPVVELVEVEPPAPEPAPVEIVMLDAADLARVPAIAAPAHPDTPPAPRRSRAPAQLAAATHAATELAPPRAIEPPAIRPPATMFDFRKGRDLEGRGRDALRISTPALERIALGGEAPPRSVVEDDHAGAIVDPHARESLVTAEITPGGRGGYKVDDLAFKGRIERDGSVSIKDKPNFRHQFTSWANVKRVLKTAGPLGLLAVGFDATDALMRRKKVDPYASRKLAFLDETRDARVELGKEYRKEVLAKTAQIVRDNLAVMWTATAPAQRKQMLFEMWDEVDETGEEELVEAGKAARAAVIGFIRARLPRGDHGFTTDELAAFNGTRRSRAVFAPYD